MLLLPILAASAMQIPDPGQFFYESLVRQLPSSGGVVDFELFVSPEGEVLECKLIYARPVRAADQSDCDRLVGKKIAKPATGPSGEPIHAQFAIVLSTSSRPSYERPADFVVEVADLPGTTRKETVHLMVAVSPQGAVNHCKQTGQGSPALAEVACQQAGAHHWASRTDKAGSPVTFAALIGIDFVQP
jgi:hypothetical protein